MTSTAPAGQRHLRLRVEGLVQGVGFRPYIHRLALQFEQRGRVANTPQGVVIELEGRVEHQQLLIAALTRHLPPFAEIHRLRMNQGVWVGFEAFGIVPSDGDGEPSMFALPDLAPCPECIRELRNPDSRYYRYPFTSCSHCGPRFSIMRAQPYDRERTSMADYPPCEACDREYRTPDNRRFHAQTIACPNCGPQLSLCNPQGSVLAHGDAALREAVARIGNGEIVALKGVGGFQLLVDAGNEQAVRRLRERKQRPEKPFALLIADLAAARALCRIDDVAEAYLSQASAPIVLSPRQPHDHLAASVAPGQAFLGIMLPASPLHQLLADDFGGPLVATSGNRHRAPLCYRNDDALHSLGDIADAFLWHDRDIVRPLDDSVLKIMAGRATLLRRARGFAPLPLTVTRRLPPSIAVGGHYKNTVAVAQGHSIVVSAHIGDLDDSETRRQFDRTVNDLQAFYAVTPRYVAHDLHPDFHGSQAAEFLADERRGIQHHVAHVFSAMAEHNLEPPVMGFAWDGVGLGDNGDILGSECLIIGAKGYQRMAHLRPMALPGGDQAAREPRRAALSVLFGLFGDAWHESPVVRPFETSELALLISMLQKGVNCPASSSAGRLFDAVASLLDLCHFNRFEGQAAMQLEQCALRSDCRDTYPYRIVDDAPAQIDWRPALSALIDDIGRTRTDDIAAKFHNTLAAIMLDIAIRAAQTHVVLSGGIFQNAVLCENVLTKLRKAGFEVYLQQTWPPNDGGLAAGQIYHLAWSEQ